MELEKICIDGLENTYAISNVKKECKNNLYDKAIILLTAFLEKNNGDYQRAIEIAENRLKWLESD